MRKPHEKLKLPFPDRLLHTDQLYARIYGSGKPLFLVHGNHGSGYIFGKLIPDLREDFSLIVVDLPGHGEGPAMPAGFMTDPQLASDYCLAVADVLEIDQFACCGHSLGGMIGLNLALQVPQRITALILLDSFVDFHERPDTLVNIQCFPGNPPDNQLEIDEAFADGPGVLWHEPFSVSERINEIICPVLEMQGESAPQSEALYDQWLKEKRGHIPAHWQVVRVPHAGHFVQLEQPEFVLKEMQRFLQKGVE